MISCVFEALNENYLKISYHHKLLFLGAETVFRPSHLSQHDYFKCVGGK